MLGMTGRVTAFLQADPVLARKPGVHGFSLLYHAALSGKTEITDLVLAAGGDEGMAAVLREHGGSS
ncbi:MAG: hypothetical protein M3Z66_18650 [Chloroflexota bacterium]|nr:hypothetical protein [Chloroflexota bacterium]